MSLVILLLIGYFALALIVQKIASKTFCAMCVSVTLSWATLVILYFKNLYTDPLIIGILMGGSVVGLVYYLFREKKKFEMFKFPFLISLFWLIYIIIGYPSNSLAKDVLILVGIWVIFVVVYIFYSNGKIRNLGRRIIECCKNW